MLFAGLGADLGMSRSILDVGLELVESFLAPLSSCPRVLAWVLSWPHGQLSL